MIEETVQVVNSEGGKIVIEAVRKSACGGCGQKQGCGVSAVSGLFSRKPVQLELDNSLDAKVGDTVVIGINDGAFLGMAFRAYLVPLLVLIVSAIILTQLLDSEWLVVLLSTLAMLGSLFMARKSDYASADLHLLRISQSPCL